MLNVCLVMHVWSHYAAGFLSNFRGFFFWGAESVLDFGALFNFRGFLFSVDGAAGFDLLVVDASLLVGGSRFCAWLAWVGAFGLGASLGVGACFGPDACLGPDV